MADLYTSYQERSCTQYLCYDSMDGDTISSM